MALSLNRRPPAARLVAAASAAPTDLFAGMESRRLLAGDLGVEIGDAFSPLDFYIPGETITVPVVVHNNYADPNPAGTRMRVTVQMLDQNNNIIISRTTAGVAAPLAPDSATTVNVGIPVLAYGGEALSPGRYSIRASVAFVDETVPEEFPADNTATETAAVTVRWAFGNVDSRSGLVFRSADVDGTTYSISASAGGSGEFFGRMTDVISRLDMQFVPGSSSSVLAFAVTGRLPGTQADQFIDLPMNIAILRPSTFAAAAATFGGIAAPALNINGEITDDMLDLPPNGSAGFKLTSGPITMHDFTGALRSNSGGIGALTVNDFQGSFFLSPPADGMTSVTTGALRFNSISNPVDSFDAFFVAGNVASLTVTQDIHDAGIAVYGNIGSLSFRDAVSARFNILGSVGSLSGRDLGGAGVVLSIQGAVGPVTLRNVYSSKLTFHSAGSTFRANEISRSSIYYAGSLTSLVTGDLNGIGNQIAINAESARFGRSVAINLGNVTSQLDLFANAHISTLSLNKWALPNTDAMRPGLIRALSAGSVIVRGVTPAGQTDPHAGLTEGQFAFIGGTGRSAAVDSVKISGLFTGQFLAGGSVGSFTAKGIDTFGGVPIQPSLVIGGTLRSFTLSNTASTAAPLTTRAALWARNFTTITANIGGAGSYFEVAAGAHFAPAALAAYITQPITDGPVSLDQMVSWSSGSVGTLNLGLRAATDNLVTRVTAGINADVSGPNRIFGGAISFGPEARTTGSATISRISTINVSGPAAANGNSIQFGFITYPTSAFTYAGTANTRISPTLPLSTPGFIPSTPGFSVPFEAFFRLGRPIIT
ncbi:MAG: hypothetical protein ACK51N_03680 [bacterium]